MAPRICGEMKRLRLTIVSDSDSWKNAYIRNGLVRPWRREGHRVRWVHHPREVRRGDVAIVYGSTRILAPEVLKRNRNTVVVHESALPAGRGWSPLAWQILKGKKRIPLTLFEAVERVDAGPVYLRGTVALRGQELADEIHAKVARGAVQLFRTFIRRYPAIVAAGKPQKGRTSFFPRRTTESSRLDPRKSLVRQFNLLRVVDNQRYPAFFYWRGARYRLTIHKA
jgi:methionyl-tRNA formyltransferase